MTPVVTIERPVSRHDFDEVRTLMRSFVAWHRERHTEDLHLIDAYFDKGVFENELATLPEYYAPPAGDLLIARCDDEVAGCVGLRPLDGESCEMKRMFVYPRWRGHGIGRSSASRSSQRPRASGIA